MASRGVLLRRQAWQAAASRSADTRTFAHSTTFLSRHRRFADAPTPEAVPLPLTPGPNALLSEEGVPPTYQHSTVWFHRSMLSVTSMRRYLRSQDDKEAIAERTHAMLRTVPRLTPIPQSIARLVPEPCLETAEKPIHTAQETSRQLQARRQLEAKKLNKNNRPPRPGERPSRPCNRHYRQSRRLGGELVLRINPYYKPKKSNGGGNGNGNSGSQ